MAENDTLTAPQKRAISALLSEKDTRAAAKTAGVSERTLWRWLTEPFFRAELSRSEGELIDHATRRLIAMQDQALDVFDQVMTDPNANYHAKLRAAEGVVSYMLKLRELRTVEERLAALERSVYENSKNAN